MIRKREMMMIVIIMKNILKCRDPDLRVSSTERLAAQGRGQISSKHTMRLRVERRA
jgi:hypothetical protein